MHPCGDEDNPCESNSNLLLHLTKQYWSLLGCTLTECAVLAQEQRSKLRYQSIRTMLR